MSASQNGRGVLCAGGLAACKPGEVCAIPQVRTAYRLIFRLVVALVLFALTFPYVAPLFYWSAPGYAYTQLS